MEILDCFDCRIVYSLTRLLLNRRFASHARFNYGQLLTIDAFGLISIWEFEVLEQI